MYSEIFIIYYMYTLILTKVIYKNSLAVHERALYKKVDLKLLLVCFVELAIQFR